MKQDNYDIVIEYIIGSQEKFYRLAYTYVRNQEDALDIVQNAICKALENYGSIRDIRTIKTWFYRVLVNESINYIKKNRKEVLMEEQKTETMAVDGNFYEDYDLYDVINGMKYEMQSIIKLRFYEEMTLKEISEITRLNINTVKARLYRALKILKQEIREVPPCVK